MKNSIVVLFSLLLVFALTACEDNTQTPKNSDSLQNNNSHSGEIILNEDAANALTLEDVKELSKKGDALTWKDFEKYYCAGDIGSGLLILKYPIDDEYFIMIGGGSLTELPFYVSLVKETNAENSIDIRYEDIDNFIEYQ